MKERWDIELLFLDGPLADNRPRWFKGPTIQIGTDPEIGGVKLPNRNLDKIHAVIDCYDGRRVMLNPTENNEVRIAAHRNENWARIDPIYRPTVIQDGNVIYIGAFGRGSMFQFIRAETFQWQQDNIQSVIRQDQHMDISLIQGAAPTQLSTSRFPKWFVPSVVSTALLTMVLIGLQLLNVFEPDFPAIGPRFDSYVHHEFVNFKEEVPASLLEGFYAPFADFVMLPNEQASGIRDLSKEPNRWDQTFYKTTIASLQRRSYWTGFWRRLQQIKDQYATVVLELREANLPEVFAAIPFQETQYKSSAVSPVCAAGIWQFMPETGRRSGLTVKDCRLKPNNVLWSPTTDSPPYIVSRDAVYVSKTSGQLTCKMRASEGTTCRVDERLDTQASTTAAVKLLTETYKDIELAESGSLVQMTILAHNAGYNDKPYLGREKRTNLLPAYRIYRNKNPRIKDGLRFYGDNIRCTSDPHATETFADRCGGVLPNQTQHYGYNVVAMHILAVCFYAKNYGNEPAFKLWKKRYLEGYCTEVNAPSLDDLRR